MTVKLTGVTLRVCGTESCTDQLVYINGPTPLQSHYAFCPLPASPIQSNHIRVITSTGSPDKW